MFRVVTLILAEATSIVDAAIAKARQLDVNVSVAVCDELGCLIAFKCMDGAPAEADRASIGKAIASAGTGLPSGEVEGAVEYTLVGTVIGEGRSAICVRGGLPIIDWSGRFPLIAKGAGDPQVRSCLIDGEAVACDGDGLPSFERLCYRRRA
jgi:uncharacterized protein GlcG (DUF336 family)